MPQLRHIAISTRDPEKTAKFFTDGFGMRIADTIDSPSATGFFLTDGHINIALLKIKNDPAAGMEYGKDYYGLHHIGFHVEDIGEAAEKLAAAGYEPRGDINTAQGLDADPSKVNDEYKYAGPEGIIVDISERGWVGTSALTSQDEAASSPKE